MLNNQQQPYEHKHTHTHMLNGSVFKQTHSHTHTHTLSLSLTHTHTHTHTLSLSPSPSLSPMAPPNSAPSVLLMRKYGPPDLVLPFVTTAATANGNSNSNSNKRWEQGAVHSFHVSCAEQTGKGAVVWIGYADGCGR